MYQQDPQLPTIVLVEHVMPYLDRFTWNACTLVCKDMYESSRKDTSPTPQWPTRHFGQVGVKTVSFSPDGLYLAVGVFQAEGNGLIHIYHVRRGLVETLHTERYNLDLMEWPTMGRLVCTDLESIQLWDMEMEGDRRLVRYWSTGEFRSIATYSERMILAIGHCHGMVSIWSLTSGEQLKVLPHHNEYVKYLRFVPGGQLVSICNGDIVCTWNVDGDGTTSTPASTETIVTYARPVSATPSGSHAAVASVDQSFVHTSRGSHVVDEISVWLWRICGAIDDEDMAAPYATHFDGHHTLPVTHILFSDDAKQMATCSFDSTVRIWDLFTGKCLHTLRGHHHHALKAQFSHDGNTVASVGYDEFHLWNYANLL